MTFPLHLDLEAASRSLPSLVNVAHGSHKLLEMGAKPVRVEERRRPTIFLEPLLVSGKDRGLAHDLERQRLVLLEALRHELRQTDRIDEARRDMSAKVLRQDHARATGGGLSPTSPRFH